MNKQTLLERTQLGKWFKVIGGNDTSYLVKLKNCSFDKDEKLIVLWLCSDETETMAFEELSLKEWSIEDGIMEIFSSGIYHFGAFEGAGDEDSIYDEDWKLNEEKMEQIVMKYAKKDFLTLTELRKKWTQLKENRVDDFEELKMKI
jgi:hypothetical protein